MKKFELIYGVFFLLVVIALCCHLIIAFQKENGMNRYQKITERIENVEIVAAGMEGALGSLPEHHKFLMDERDKLTLEQIEGVQ